MKKVIVVVELDYPDDTDVARTGGQLVGLFDDALTKAGVDAGEQMYVASGPTAQIVLGLFASTEGS